MRQWTLRRGSEDAAKDVLYADRENAADGCCLPAAARFYICRVRGDNTRAR